jgi:hypothetical protein
MNFQDDHNELLYMKRGIEKANKGRYIGGGRDESAPTDIRCILLKGIIIVRVML